MTLKCNVIAGPYDLVGGWKLLIVCHHTAKFGAQRHRGSGDMFLICHVDSKDHALKALCNFMGGSASW